MRKLVMGVVLLLLTWGGLSQRAATSSRVVSPEMLHCVPGSLEYCQDVYVC